jgi:hypothetical protein
MSSLQQIGFEQDCEGASQAVPIETQTPYDMLDAKEQAESQDGKDIYRTIEQAAAMSVNSEPTSPFAEAMKAAEEVLEKYFGYMRKPKTETGRVIRQDIVWKYLTRTYLKTSFSDIARRWKVSPALVNRHVREFQREMQIELHGVRSQESRRHYADAARARWAKKKAVQ